MEPKSKTIEAIIISRRDWGEADRLLTAFSRNEGKIRIVARGARKLKSKMACHIEPFCYGKYSLHQGKKYDILTGAESKALFSDITSDVNLYEDATYLCELLDMTTVEGQVHESLFNLFKKSLERLSAAQDYEREIILRDFEFHLLEQIGYETQYQKCRLCGRELLEQPEYFGDFEGFLCQNCGKTGHKIDKNTLKVLRHLKEKKDLLKIKGIERYNKSLITIILGYLYDILPRIPRSKKYEFRK